MKFKKIIESSFLICQSNHTYRVLSKYTPTNEPKVLLLSLIPRIIRLECFKLSD